MSPAPAIDARRVLADLRELARRTGDETGAQREFARQGWRDARAFLVELLDEIEIGHEIDEAGNLWARIEGADRELPAIVVGSHVDAVPQGGWLDGSLGVIAALGVLRTWAGADAKPPRDLVLVDWADEEGSRLGRSLFGSAAFSGSLEIETVLEQRDGEGVSLADALAENEIDPQRVVEASSRAGGLGGYLELHIEQGPVLESEGTAVAAVAGCVGIERARFIFSGQASHAGTTPMDRRRDAGLAAAVAALAIEQIPAHEGGVATTGSLQLKPGIVTAVAGRATLSVDLRHPEEEALARMLASARAAAGEAARERGCELEEETVWRIAATPFDPDLVAQALHVVRELGGREEAITSGALHDAAEVAAVIPATMLFVSSIGGISHAPEENSADVDLEVGITALAQLAERLLAG